MISFPLLLRDYSHVISVGKLSDYGVPVFVQFLAIT